jgi:hypothetical protein
MTATAFRPVQPTSLRAIVQPLLLLAALAFFAGFGGYLILGPHHVLRAADPLAPVAAVAGPTDASTTPEPTSIDDANLPQKA